MRTLLATFVLASAASAQSGPLLFDMGNGPVEDGYTQVLAATTFTTGAGYGWVEPDVPQDDVSYNEIAAVIAHTSRADVLIDSVINRGQTNDTSVFRANVDAGHSYRCTVIIGDVGSAEGTCGASVVLHTPLEHLGVAVKAGDAAEFESVAEDLLVRTVYSKGSLYPYTTTAPSCPNGIGSTGGYLKLRFTVEVPSGETGAVQIRFTADPGGSSHSYNSIQGIEIVPAVEPPIRFDHGTGYLVTSSTDPAVADFIAKLSGNDVAGARTAIGQIVDPLTQACAQLWMAGWLVGEEEGQLAGSPQDVDLADAITTLDGIATDPDPGPEVHLARELRDEAVDFQAALYFNRLRAYLSDQIPVPDLPDDFLPLEPIDECKPALPGYTTNCMIKRLGAADLLFRQIRGDMLSADEPLIESSPLLPRADYSRASQYWSRATQTVPNDVSGGGDPNVANFWIDLIDALDDSQLFPLAANLAMFAHMKENYFQPGVANSGIVASWTGSTSHAYWPPGEWWGLGEFIPTVPVTGPDWAVALRGYLFSVNGVARWWIDRRLNEGELGGGDGDDVELTGALWATPRIYSPDATYLEEGEVEAALRRASDEVLYGASVNQLQGYFQGAGDSEHAGEFTSHTLFGLLPARYGDPSYLDVVTRLAHNAQPDEPGATDDAPWFIDKSTGPPADPLWLFRSYIFGATDVDDSGDPIDIPLNMRGLSPLLDLVEFDPSPDAVAIVLNLARAWRIACMDTSPAATIPKPVGIPPAAIRTGPAVAFPPPTYGDGGEWWTNAYTASPQYLDYTYQLLSLAYRLTQDEQYLEPLYHSALLAEQYQTAFDPPGDPLDPADPAENEVWAAVKYRSVILANLFDAREELYATSLPSAQDVADFDDLLESKGGPWMKLALADLDPVVGKNKTTIKEHFDKANVWMQYYWPLATSAVSYTDRAFFSIQGSFQTLYSAVSGDHFNTHPRPAVSWENLDPDDANPDQQVLDLAPLVLEVGSDRLHMLVHNFADSQVDVGFRLWHRLALGDYDLDVDVDADGDDLPDDPAPTPPIAFSERGQLFEVSLDSQATTAIVFTRVSSGGFPTTGVADPAVGIGDVAHDGSQVWVRVHNLGTAALEGAVTVDVEAGGLSIGSAQVTPAQVGQLEDFAPAWVAVPVGTLPSPLNDPIEVSLSYGFDQLTQWNDHVSVAEPALFAEVEHDIGCSNGCGAEPQISASPPFLGNDEFRVEISGAGAGPAYVRLSFSPALAASPGCAPWLQTPFVFAPVTLDQGEGAYPLPLTLADGTLTAGLEFYAQFAAVDGSCVELTDVLKLTLQRP